MAENMDEYTDEREDATEYKDGGIDYSTVKANHLINQHLVGILDELTKDEAIVRLTCTEDMVLDEKGLIHSGFIFSSANYAATAAVNSPYSILAVSKVNFLAPLALNDVVIFKAKAMQTESRKRVVEVIGYLHDVKVFEGEFSVVVLERHVMSLHLM
ncbi:MAG: PaaI family thioesterase [Campylobacterales bacterium]|nr:PaaI family thioesterase [Campylobacterales bacterium]